MASRLTGLARGGEILVGENLYNGIAGMVHAGEVTGGEIKGIDSPVRLYNIAGLKGPWKSEVRGVIDYTISRLEGEDLLP